MTAGPVPPKETTRKPRGRFSYGEDVDEAPKLLNEEPVDVEAGTPAEDRSSVESVPPEPDRTSPPAFEE